MIQYIYIHTHPVYFAYLKSWGPCALSRETGLFFSCVVVKKSTNGLRSHWLSNMYWWRPALLPVLVFTEKLARGKSRLCRRRGGRCQMSDTMNKQGKGAVERAAISSSFEKECSSAKQYQLHVWNRLNTAIVEQHFFTLKSLKRQSGWCIRRLSILFWFLWVWKSFAIWQKINK